jgi:PPOX class probable F420-dependent enzyme
MPGMSQSEIREFLKRPLIAKVSTISPDGSPYISPVWFEYSDSKVYIIARKHSRYVEHIKKNPKVAVLIDDDTAPYAKVHFTGTAKILEGPTTSGRWVEIARRMASRHFGESIGPKYLEGTLDQPRYLIEITPTQTVSWRGTGRGDRSEWHPRYYEPGSRWHTEYIKKETNA